MKKLLAMIATCVTMYAAPFGTNEFSYITKYATNTQKLSRLSDLVLGTDTFLVYGVPLGETQKLVKIAIKPDRGSKFKQVDVVFDYKFDDTTKSRFSSGMDAAETILHILSPDDSNTGIEWLRQEIKYQTWVDSKSARLKLKGCDVIALQVYKDWSRDTSITSGFDYKAVEINVMFVPSRASVLVRREIFMEGIGKLLPQSSAYWSAIKPYHMTRF
jgi:hypothetical protein